uniref:Uncharacterized protein n=1 Tax=Magallana gigas TaxID=29159 RepID=A0A8W8P2J5_MAGGI
MKGQSKIRVRISKSKIAVAEALGNREQLNDKKKFTGNRPLNACTATSGHNKIICRKKCRQTASVQRLLKPNISLWVALMENPIMGTTLQEIFLVLNCPALSYSGLQFSWSGNVVVICTGRVVCPFHRRWQLESKQRTQNESLKRCSRNLLVEFKPAISVNQSTDKNSWSGSSAELIN